MYLLNETEWIAVTCGSENALLLNKGKRPPKQRETPERREKNPPCLPNPWNKLNGTSGLQAASGPPKRTQSGPLREWEIQAAVRILGFMP